MSDIKETYMDEALFNLDDSTPDVGEEYDRQKAIEDISLMEQLFISKKTNNRYLARIIELEEILREIIREIKRVADCDDIDKILPDEIKQKIFYQVNCRMNSLMQNKSTNEIHDNLIKKREELKLFDKKRRERLRKQQLRHSPQYPTLEQPSSEDTSSEDTSSEDKDKKDIRNFFSPSVDMRYRDDI